MRSAIVGYMDVIPAAFLFYEEVPFHPELLLKDLVKVFHPDILKDYTPRYFTNLAE